MSAPQGALAVPDNMTVLFLPPHGPELNPVERLWAYLRSHFLSNRVFDNDQHLLDGGAEAWQQLTPERLRSVCACTYLTHEDESRFVSVVWAFAVGRPGIEFEVVEPESPGGIEVLDRSTLRAGAVGLKSL